MLNIYKSREPCYHFVATLIDTNTWNIVLVDCKIFVSLINSCSPCDIGIFGYHTSLREYKI
jgi:hypothetical protein